MEGILGLTTYIAHLGQRYGHNLAAACADAVEDGVSQIPILIGEQLGQLVALLCVEAIQVGHGDYFLAVGWVSDSLDRIRGQNFRPRCLGAAYAQLIIGKTCFECLHSVTILLVDLLHCRRHRLASAAVLTGKENTQRGRQDAPYQA